MFYFKTIKIPDTSPELIERAIRSFTIKNSSYSDLLSTAGEDYENKFFSGLEKDDALLLTRMRYKKDSSFEFRRRTKVFIRFRKDKGFTSYQIRFSLISSLLFCFLLLVTIFSILHAFSGGNPFWFVILLQGAALVGTIASVEVDVIQTLVNKAIERTRSEEEKFPAR